MILSSRTSEENLRSQADELLEKAKELRATIPSTDDSSTRQEDLLIPPVASQSRWSVENSPEDGVDYRLYIDLGRESGTWMDPRWAASGKRIEFTLDVCFTQQQSTQEGEKKMVKDNLSGRSSATLDLNSATKARLRNGFDEMKCDGGAYRIDNGQNGQTVRFYVNVDGTPERGSPYGDIFVPKGCLYFSIPCFSSISQLSQKEGIVTVRQTGWHTGWRREESRIVGVFRAKSISKARQIDGY